MVIGGMFNVLQEALSIIEGKEEAYFTKEELKNITGLSDQAVSNNITRLVKAGFLERVEYVDPNCRGRFRKYRLKGGDINEFVNNYFM